MSFIQLITLMRHIVYAVSEQLTALLISVSREYVGKYKVLNVKSTSLEFGGKSPLNRALSAGCEALHLEL